MHKNLNKLNMKYMSKYFFANILLSDIYQNIEA